MTLKKLSLTFFQNDVKSWVNMRIKQITDGTKYTYETVIEDISAFVNLLHEATFAVTSLADIDAYFRIFGVDYYAITSRWLDISVHV